LQIVVMFVHFGFKSSDTKLDLFQETCFIIKRVFRRIKMGLGKK
jgi:hypothetical protein